MSTNAAVSCDGNELLILTLRSLAIFRATGTAGGAAQKPILTVHLPTDIEGPRHEVETSSGHLVILHYLKQVVGDTGESEEELKMKRMFVVSKIT